MTAARTGYHHGNLRSALLDAGVELARIGGPDAVVVREASRRAGVSHNAAYRHFADRDSLLTAVCGRCMSALARLMEARIGDVGSDLAERATALARLRATGAAYLEFALTEPGWFRTAFAVPAGLDYLGEGEGVGDSGLGPLELLGAQLDALMAVGVLEPQRRPHVEFVAWSGVHGLAMLLLDGPLRELPQAEVEAITARLFGLIERGL